MPKKLRQALRRCSISLILTLVFFIVLSQRFGFVPPMGKFLDPFQGFWQNAEAFQHSTKSISLNGLQKPVDIVFDSLGIPHIFAQANEDLFFAQGYVTARDRLWQMEFQTQATAGRLSEIIGPAAIEYDRHQRRLGIPHAAQLSLELMEKNPETKMALENYAAGVNAYIQSLNTASYPLEYKLLDYAPEEWTPLQTALLLKYMQWTLSGANDEMALSNTLNKFGPVFIEKFYPLHPQGVDPIIPPETPWNFTPIAKPNVVNTFTPALVGQWTGPDKHNGSNNFAVNGKKVIGGGTILANDPHLDLSLPSIWYAIHLHAPNYNASGASLPGTPSIVIGFNNAIAWGLTNGKDDVLDWYQLKFKDSTLAEYWHENQWKRTTPTLEEFKVYGGEDIYDTVIYTHHGPVVIKPGEKAFDNKMPPAQAMHWIANTPSNELLAFIHINQAQDESSFVAALAPYNCPAQNFAYADKQGHIALIHAGLFPLRWTGQGRLISDGTDARFDWKTWVPATHNPQVTDPAREFISSANQDITDSTYPYFLAADFLDPDRGNRINQSLSESESLSVADIQNIQLDNLSLHAQLILPFMLQALDTLAMDEIYRPAIADLRHWEYHYVNQQAAPSLFDLWWSNLYVSIWNDDFGNDSTRYIWPTKARTRQLLLEEPNSLWYDDLSTPEKENLGLLLRRSFLKAYATLKSQNGNYGSNWHWGKIHRVNINHLAHIPAFAITNLTPGSCSDCINAQRGTNAPSWRMVVQLGKNFQAYGIYPGGQSGNPGSPFYANFIADWSNGKLRPLNFPNKTEDLKSLYTLHLGAH